MSGHLTDRLCACGRRLWRVFVGPAHAPHRYAVRVCAVCDLPEGS